MKSIRLSLIVYFLVLMTGALGAVSWFSYRTTAEALRAGRRDSEVRIQAQFTGSSDALKADLDRRILRQAHTLVNVSQSMYIHAEGQFALLGLMGSGAMPNGYLNFSLFYCELLHKDVYPDIFKAQSLSTHIEHADKLVADEDGHHAQEYFQTYRSNGSPMERSESMGDQAFDLDENFRMNAELNAEKYDEKELQHGVKVRRVTLKTSVPGYGLMFLPYPVKGVQPPPVFPKWGPGVLRPPQKEKEKNKGGKGAGQPRPFEAKPPVTKTPVIFIQYASDLSSTEAKIVDLRDKRDRQIAQLQTNVQNDLQQLRSRMIWIGLSALAALWFGGYLVIRLGLAPLSKMSEAVSQVSVKDFHLPLDAQQLPNELQPIAERLTVMLDELQKAFAREKQAAADISHELRTPLAALMTTLEVGLKKKRSVDEYQEILDDCRSSGQHMYQLVERLLTLARLDAGADRYHAAEADVTDIALQCADLIRPLAKARGLALRLHLPETISTRTDANKVRELLINLLHNAVEYNKPNGAIDLAVERVNGRVRLEVRDTGIGITPDSLEHIFERFYRADPSRHADTPHAGLGLAIVKSYIDLMSGTIRVESSAGGTAFIVELPFVASIRDVETAVREGAVLAQR